MLIVRRKSTVSRQKKLIDVRTHGLRRALEGSIGWGFFNSDSQAELAYLMGASHALRWVSGEDPNEPALFRIPEKKKPEQKAISAAT